MGTQLYPYKPETITRALRNLRAQIICNGEPGKEHVEALLGRISEINTGKKFANV